MQQLTHSDMVEWLIILQTKIHKGSVFTGGTLKGQDIRTHYTSLSYDDVHAEWLSYQC